MSIPRLSVDHALAAGSWPLAYRHGAAPLVVAMERSLAVPPRDLALPPGVPLALLVGPEGGFMAAELDDPPRRPFVVPAALGPRILRAEIAAVAGLAALQALSGDWA